MDSRGEEDEVGKRKRGLLVAAELGRPSKAKSQLRSQLLHFSSLIYFFKILNEFLSKPHQKFICTT